MKILEAPTTCMSSIDKHYQWNSSLISSPFQSGCNTIFIIELYMNDKGAYYTTEPTLFSVKYIDKLISIEYTLFIYLFFLMLFFFQEKFDALFVNTLLLCQQVNQVHPALLQNLTFSRELYIKSVDVEESIIASVRTRITEAYRRSIIPLLAYSRKFEKYLDLFAIEPRKYVEYVSFFFFIVIIQSFSKDTRNILE